MPTHGMTDTPVTRWSCAALCDSAQLFHRAHHMVSTCSTASHHVFLFLIQLIKPKSSPHTDSSFPAPPSPSSSPFIRLLPATQRERGSAHFYAMDSSVAFGRHKRNRPVCLIPSHLSHLLTPAYLQFCSFVCERPRLLESVLKT